MNITDTLIVAFSELIGKGWGWGEGGCRHGEL